MTGTACCRLVCYVFTYIWHDVAASSKAFVAQCPFTHTVSHRFNMLKLLVPSLKSWHFGEVSQTPLSSFFTYTTATTTTQIVGRSTYSVYRRAVVWGTAPCLDIKQDYSTRALSYTRVASNCCKVLITQAPYIASAACAFGATNQGLKWTCWRRRPPTKLSLVNGIPLPCLPSHKHQDHPS